MEKEISSGTMLGIVLIALAAVIGLGFGVFSIAKGVANEGTVNVQDNLGTVSESSFEDYNDKIVTGTMVKSAVTTFADKPVGILINTTAMDKGVKPYSGHKSIQVYALADSGSSELTTPDEVRGSWDSLGSEDSSVGAATGEALYVNYNALFGSEGETTDDEGVTTITWATPGNLTLKDGVFTAKGIPFAVDPGTGKVKYDKSVGGFGRSGNCEYIAPTAKFTANLIKDESGTTIGIVFTQNAQ